MAVVLDAPIMIGDSPRGGKHRRRGGGQRSRRLGCLRLRPSLHKIRPLLPRGPLLPQGPLLPPALRR
eukprot:3486882-Lingulodinium_polyedra.AAC.1